MSFLVSLPGSLQHVSACWQLAQGVAVVCCCAYAVCITRTSLASYGELHDACLVRKKFAVACHICDTVTTMLHGNSPIMLSSGAGLHVLTCVPTMRRLYCPAECVESP
jgi:hypothetical protein